MWTPFTTFINTVPKFVATSAPLDTDWANGSAIDRGLVDFVQALKNRPGGDIGIHASISVARILLTAGVVDELRLVIAPTIAGAGRKLLDELPPIRLAPIRSVISKTMVSGYKPLGKPFVRSAGSRFSHCQARSASRAASLESWRPIALAA
jgi:dihydrofolate reductase